MEPYIVNILEETLNNTFFRKVLYTASNMQLVVMCLKPNEDIGAETHATIDQFIRIEKGEGKAVVDGKEFILKDDSVVIIPKGALHNIINTSKDNELKLYTIYSPVNHKPNTIHKTKMDALEAEKAEYS